MAITTGNGGTNSRTQTTVPYWDRIEPIDGGYTIIRANGREAGQVRVFDDRAGDGAIHVQFSVGRGKATKVATFHLDGPSEIDDLIEALTVARDKMA